MIRKSELKDFLLYLIVGGLATLIEWLVFYILNGVFSVYYEIGTIIAYLISTFFNWLFGRIILFKKSNKKLVVELLSIYGASLIGLGMNLLIMWVAVELFTINEMISKIVATVIVFLWNFLVREFVIYREKK